MRNPLFRHISSILITFILSVWCSGASAYQVGTTSTGAEIKWNTNDATYYINTSGGPSGSLAAIQAAMQTWTDVSTSPFNFIYGGTTSSTAYGTNDGTNIIVFGLINTTGTVGLNTFTYYVSSGQLIDSDIKLNTYYPWVTDGSPNGFDVQNVATHELGHSLNLADLYSSADTEKTMYGYTSYGETKRRTLEQDDIDGITYLYPQTLKKGDRVKSTTDDLHIRSCSSTTCNIICEASTGNTGTIVGGPQQANNYTWWQISWDDGTGNCSSGTTGWSVEKYLIKSDPQLPNLTPYKPLEWSDKIVVSKTTGTNIDSSPLYTTDTLYIDWAVINNGTGAITDPFGIKLYVDGGERFVWPIPQSIDPGSYIRILDYSIGTLSAGTHSVKIVLDVTDAVKESNESDNEYTKTITVADSTDTTPPSVVSTSPHTDETNVAVNTNITVTFSESMDASTISNSTFTVKMLPNLYNVTGTVTYDDTTKTATFTPSENLSYLTKYYVTITNGVKDIAGNPMAKDYPWFFTTADSTDTTPPSVVSTSPDKDETNVAVNTTITATFSESMDASTISDSTFTVKMLPNLYNVTGTVNYDETTKKATFTPSENLNYSTKYTATITKEVKNLAGNPMTDDYSWSFTTVSAPPSIIISIIGDLDFGEVPIGTSTEKIMTISNAGTSTENLKVNSIQYPDKDFSGDWNSGEIMPGESQDVNVTFTPTYEQEYRGNVIVSSNATDGENKHYISGKGITCSYVLDPKESNFNSDGGEGSFTVITSPNDCCWSAKSDVDWIEITTESSGCGSEKVVFLVGTNTTESKRDGTITVEDKIHTVHQEGIPTCAKDDHEQNNDFGNDNDPLVCGDEYTGTICNPSDSDFYTIDVKNSGKISLSLDVPDDKDYDFYLYNALKEEVGFSTNGTGVTEQLTYYTNAPGMYYIKVIGNSSNDYSENQTYTLSGIWPCWKIEELDSPKTIANFCPKAIDVDANNHVHIAYGGNHLYYAHFDGNTWGTPEIVDSFSGVGQFASLRIDKSGYIHISYYDSKHGNLKYANNISGKWDIEIADGSQEVGMYSSLGLDKSGNPHISYYDKRNKDLKYANKVAGSWKKIVVDSRGYVGKYTFIRLDSADKVHISYYDEGSKNLKYATNVSGKWVPATVDSSGDVGKYTSLGIGKAGKKVTVHICYYDEKNKDLKYINNVAGKWKVEFVDSIEDVGKFTSMRVKSDKAYVSYYDETKKNLKYGSNSSGSWKTEVVDSRGYVGKFTSIDIDSAGKAHISYFDSTKKVLKHATNAD